LAAARRAIRLRRAAAWARARRSWAAASSCAAVKGTRIADDAAATGTGADPVSWPWPRFCARSSRSLCGWWRPPLFGPLPLPLLSLSPAAPAARLRLAVRPLISAGGGERDAAVW